MWPLPAIHGKILTAPWSLKASWAMGRKFEVMWVYSLKVIKLYTFTDTIIQLYSYAWKLFRVWSVYTPKSCNIMQLSEFHPSISIHTGILLFFICLIDFKLAELIWSDHPRSGLWDVWCGGHFLATQPPFSLVFIESCSFLHRWLCWIASPISSWSSARPWNLPLITMILPMISMIPRKLLRCHALLFGCGLQSRNMSKFSIFSIFSILPILMFM